MPGITNDGATIITQRPAQGVPANSPIIAGVAFTNDGAAYVQYAGGALVARQPDLFDGFNFAAHWPQARQWPFGLARGIDNRVTSVIDPSTMIPFSTFASATAYYVDVTAGNNANGGTSWADAKQSFSQAITLVNTAAAAAIVYVKAGTYIRTHGWNGATRFTQPVMVVGVGGRVILGLHDNATWGVDGTYANTYSTTTFTTAARVVDVTNLTDDGDYTELAEVATPTLCNTTENSWAQDGSKIYVNRADNAVVSNTNTRVYRHSVEGARCATTGDTICIGLEFEGGNNGGFIADANASGSSYLINCKAKWAGRSSSPVDGFKARNVALMACFGCVAAHNSKDGFNYTAASGTSPQGVTIGCSGYENGMSPSTSNNGLTYHDGCVGIDIGGRYYRNYGGNVVITGAACELWCVGTEAESSYGDVVFGGTNVPNNYYALDTAELFLDNCAGRDSTYEFRVDSTGDLYYRNHVTDNSTNLNSGGTIAEGAA